jgi:AraC-like DNA-binding protein
MDKDLIIYTPMYVTFFWAIILFLSPSENRAKKFLGVFMVFAFLVYLSHAFYFKHFESTYLIFDSIYILASLSVYPLYYWYIKILTVETEYNLKNLKFLLPAVVLALTTAIIYLLMSPDERYVHLHGFLLKNEINRLDTFLVQFQKIVFFASRIVFVVQVVYFLYLGQKLVVKYNQRVANFYSNLESKTIVWVKLLLYSFVVASAMGIVFNLIGRSQFLHSTILLLIPSIIFSFLLFVIGFQGYMQNHTVLNLVNDEKLQPKKKQKNYTQSQLKEKMLNLFENEKIYINSDLKITHISEKLQTNRTYISHIINGDFSCSFSEFVNKYRVSEAKKMLSNDLNNNYSMNFISETVGFGSLNTFMRVFRESEGVTPGHFREIQRKKQASE